MPSEAPSSGRGPFFPDQRVALPRAFGKYTLLRLLGSGGMADAYLGLQLGAFGFEKLVVIKCLKPSLNGETRVVHMFMDEARLGTTLAHSNIVQVFDAGQADDTYFIVMEYVEGVDLGKARRTRRSKGQPAFPLEHAIYVVSELLSALSYAHQKTDRDGNPLSVVHRDISPGNVLLSFDGNVKLTDFGVAKSALQLGERTAFGELKGKIAYMAPEQAQGRPVDLRTDLFAASAILYELTTGLRLFGNLSEVDTLALAMTGEHPRPRSVCRHFPESLESIIEVGLCADPAARYQSAREMQRDLLHFSREAGLGLSEASFSEWLNRELSEVKARRSALLRSAWDFDRRAKQQEVSPERAASNGTPDHLPPTGPVVTASGAGPVADEESYSAGARSDRRGFSSGSPRGAPFRLMKSAPPAQAPRPRRRRRTRFGVLAAFVVAFVLLLAAPRRLDLWWAVTRAVGADAIEQLKSSIRSRLLRLGGVRASFVEHGRI